MSGLAQRASAGISFVLYKLLSFTSSSRPFLPLRKYLPSREAPACGQVISGIWVFLMGRVVMASETEAALQSFQGGAVDPQTLISVWHASSTIWLNDWISEWRRTRPRQLSRERSSWEFSSLPQVSFVQILQMITAFICHPDDLSQVINLREEC